VDDVPKPSETPPKRRLGKRDLLKLGVFAIIAVVLFFAVDQWDLRALSDPAVLEARVASMGNWVWVAYIGLWIVLQIAIGQTLIPTVAGGVLFGWLVGGFMALGGAIISTTLHLLLVRTLLRKPAEALIAGRFEHIRDGIEERGVGLLVLMRFLWLPSSIITVGTALTRIPVRHHLVGVPFMLPQALLWTLATESIYRYGWGAIPAGRWIIFGAIAATSIVGYLAAMRRWPQLKAFTRKRS
jgi:uncharacterized membrane protein YdjX (TVP38/TMEM64 family)